MTLSEASQKETEPLPQYMKLAAPEPSGIVTDWDWPEEIEKEFENSGYGDFKTKVAEAVVKKIEPIQKKYKELLANKEYLEKIYTKGAEKARKLASKTLEDVKERIGII